MTRRPPRSTRVRSSAASDVYKRQRVPFLLFLSQTRFESGEVRLEGGLPGGIELRQLLGDGPGHHAAVFRIGPVVRVPVRMHVAHRAGDLLRRPLEDVAADRSIQISGVSRMNLVVAA